MNLFSRTHGGEAYLGTRLNRPDDFRAISMTQKGYQNFLHRYFSDSQQITQLRQLIAEESHSKDVSQLKSHKIIESVARLLMSSRLVAAERQHHRKVLVAALVTTTPSLPPVTPEAPKAPQPNTTNQLSKTIVIIVPGIMGTSLYSGNASAFDVEGACFRADLKKLSDFQTPLYSHLYPVNGLHEAFLSGLKSSLETSVNNDLKSRSTHKQLEACYFGYDWRQDNVKSAKELADLVDDKLSRPGVEQVILIAHSMGGLVSRYYCKVGGGESKVKALFLIGSPTHGSPESFFTLKTGHVRGWKLTWGLFNTDSLDRMLHFFRRCPSLYQLLPTRLYGQYISPEWLKIFLTPQNSWIKLVHEKYLSMLKKEEPQPINWSDPQGAYLKMGTIIQKDSQEDEVNIIRGNIVKAINFHEKLIVKDNAYMHPNTEIICGSGMETVDSCSITPPVPSLNTQSETQSVTEYSTSKCGDETVPLLSSNGPRPSAPSDKILILPNIGHQALPSSKSCVDYITKRIIEMLTE